MRVECSRFVINHKKQTGLSAKIEIPVSLNSRTDILKGVIVFSWHTLRGVPKGSTTRSLIVLPLRHHYWSGRRPSWLTANYSGHASLCMSHKMPKVRRKFKQIVMSTHTDFFYQATLSQTHLMLEQHLPPVILMLILTSLTSHIPCDLPLFFLQFLSSVVRNFPSSTTSSALLVSIVSLRPPVLPVRPSHERLVHYSFNSASLSNLALDFSYYVTIISGN